MNIRELQHIPVIILSTTRGYQARKQYIDKLLYQLPQLGISPQNIKIHYSVSLPLEDKIAKYILQFATEKIDHSAEYYIKPATYNTVLNHYIIIKQYYELGFKTIIVFEDDCMISDISTVLKYLITLPNDFDIARPSIHEYKINYKYLKKINQFWYKQLHHHKYFYDIFGSLVFTIYNQNGMKFYLDFIDKNGYISADHPVMNTTSNINHYVIPVSKSVVRDLSSTREIPSLIN